MDLHLRGHVALVTGISRGIGKAIAERLAGEGVHVVGCSRATPTALPEGVTHVPLDLTEPDAAQRLVDTALRSHGRLDMVVNNAGGGYLSAGYAALDDDGWARHLTLNLLVPMRVIRAALPGLSDGGVIVNMSSVNAAAPSTTAPAYSAAKAGLDNLTTGLARELRGRAIRVVGVAAGPVDTDLWLGDEGIGAGMEQLTGRPRDEVVAAARAAQPFGRFATPEEIADVVAFVASPRAAMISGTTIRVDGGLSAVR